MMGWRVRVSVCQHPSSSVGPVRCLARLGSHHLSWPGHGGPVTGIGLELLRIAVEALDPVAALLWLLGSVGFSLYVNFLGDYNKTYGAVTGVIVLLLWLFLTCYIVLLGAEINAEAERQTARDTTIGEPRPMGQRGAVVADSLPGHNPPEHNNG
jgi:Virulence factor BrkB